MLSTLFVTDVLGTTTAPIDPATIIPTVPTIVLVLLNFFAPYLVSVISSPLWPKSATKWISIAISGLLAAVVLIIAHFAFGFAIPAWPQLILLGIVVTQASYSLLLKDSADAVKNSTGVGTFQGVPNVAVTGTAQSTAGVVLPPEAASEPAPVPQPSGNVIRVGS